MAKEISIGEGTTQRDEFFKSVVIGVNKLSKSTSKSGHEEVNKSLK
jgi:hypothetical protein